MRRIALALVGLAVFAAPSVAQASGAKPERAVFASGTSPQGEHWSAAASVDNNRRRHLWRFEIGFKFSLGFGWGSGQEIPVGSHERMEGQADGYTGILSGGRRKAPPSATRDPK